MLQQIKNKQCEDNLLTTCEQTCNNLCIFMRVPKPSTKDKKYPELHIYAICIFNLCPCTNKLSYYHIFDLKKSKAGRKFYGFRSTVPERKIFFPPMVKSLSPAQVYLRVWVVGSTHNLNLKLI